MWAAANGKSNIGIPASVGKEFAEADPGGHLPARAKDMAGTDWRGLIKGLIKFFAEEAQEPEHGEDAGWEEGKHPRGESGKFSTTATGHEGAAHIAKAGFKPTRSVKSSTGELVHSYEHKEKGALHTRVHPSTGQVRSWLHDPLTGRHQSSSGRGVEELSKHLSTIPEKYPSSRFDPDGGPSDPSRHARRRAEDIAIPRAASTAFVAPDGKVLLLRRGDAEDNFPGHWCFPGGKVDDGETPLAGAAREAREELGRDCSYDAARALPSVRTRHGWDHTTFLVPVEDAFEPKLNAEHSAHVWAYPDALPEPMHPAVAETIRGIAGDASEVPKPGAPRPEVKDADESFEELERSLAHRKGVKDPEALAAYIGRKHGKIPAADAAPMVADSAREYDEDGRLHVARCNLTRAAVNGYRGDEIPDHEALGLDPGKVYRLLRDPEELKKAVGTFNGLPILFVHQPATAEDHPTELVIGATGNTAEWVDPFIQNSLVIWPEYATDAIEDGAQKQLSAGYKFKADMRPGVYQGEPFDGRMTSIVGNHMATVREGRAGPTVTVADGDPVHRQWLAIERAILRI